MHLNLSSIKFLRSKSFSDRVQRSLVRHLCIFIAYMGGMEEEGASSTKFI